MPPDREGRGAGSSKSPIPTYVNTRVPDANACWAPQRSRKQPRGGSGPTEPPKPAAYLKDKTIEEARLKADPRGAYLFQSGSAPLLCTLHRGLYTFVAELTTGIGNGFSEVGFVWRIR